MLISTLGYDTIQAIQAMRMYTYRFYSKQMTFIFAILLQAPLSHLFLCADLDRDWYRENGGFTEAVLWYPHHHHLVICCIHKKSNSTIESVRQHRTDLHFAIKFRNKVTHIARKRIGESCTFCLFLCNSYKIKFLLIFCQFQFQRLTIQDFNGYIYFLMDDTDINLYAV